MDFPTAKLLGVGLSRFGLSEAITACEDRVRSARGGYVCFVNVHSLTESTDTPRLRDTLNHAFLSLADGVPLVWASRWLSAPIASRVCGPDFMKAFIEKNKGLRHAFVGGMPGQGDALARAFALDPLKTTCMSPPVRPFSEQNAAEDWRQCASTALATTGQLPQVVWVGLGAPKQEYWMRTVSELAPNTLFFGVGAAFDFLTGTKKRAPVWMQKSGLEWVHRLMQEPGRLCGRYLRTNSLFVWKLLTELKDSSNHL